MRLLAFSHLADIWEGHLPNEGDRACSPFVIVTALILSYRVPCCHLWFWNCRALKSGYLSAIELLSWLAAADEYGGTQKGGAFA